LATSRTLTEDQAGQNTWTRDLARDLFPGTATPFAWTLLRAPAEVALRQALADLGAVSLAGRPLWRHGGDTYVYVNAGALAEAGRSLYGAAWLGTVAGEPPNGLLSRFQASNIRRKAQARIAAAVAEVPGAHERLARWLAWVCGLRWTQADLLQVMEELEPQAGAALLTYFILRAGMTAAGAHVARRLADWLPERPADLAWGLYAGLEGLPTVEAAYALAVAARDPASREAALARHGHRGPGEMRPDALRWSDHPEHLADLAEQHFLRNPDTARVHRGSTEAWTFGRLEQNQGRQFEPILRYAQGLCRAVDIAWDALCMVMAAAQRWASAVAAEAVAAWLIAQPADVLSLELEELKQIATGEWHGGRSEEVREEVERRRVQVAVSPSGTDFRPGPASPGHAHGPVYLTSPALQPPPPGAIWLAEAADPGCAPYWLGAGGVVTTTGDPWAPGLIAARALGLPAVLGGAAAVAQARPEQMAVVNGDTGEVVFE